MEDLRKKKNITGLDSKLSISDRFYIIKRKITKKILWKTCIILSVLLIFVFPYQIGKFLSWWLTNFLNGLF